MLMLINNMVIKYLRKAGNMVDASFWDEVFEMNYSMIYYPDIGKTIYFHQYLRYSH